MESRHAETEARKTREEGERKTGGFQFVMSFFRGSTSSREKMGTVRSLELIDYCFVPYISDVSVIFTHGLIE